MRQLYGRVSLCVLFGAACAGGAASGAAGTTFPATRPVPAVMDCLATALDSAEYRVVRLDRKRGSLDARREDEAAPTSSDLREFKRGDRLEVDLTKDKQSYVVKASTFRELRSQLGSETEFGAATPTGLKDAAYFVGRCGGT